MFKAFLYELMEIVARLHEKFLAINDAHELALSDKMLHFYVIGIIGMAVVFIIHPLFKYLARTGHVMVITWLYVFTLILVLTFSIEIGQRITHTGNMEFADIVFGVGGFLLMFLLFIMVRGVILGIASLFKRK